MITAQRIIAPIVEHQSVAPSYYRLRLKSKHIALAAQPGQFVHILPRTGSVLDPLLRRAFSIFRIEKDTFEILYKAIGKGTRQMSSWQVGGSVDVIGPLGQPFKLENDSNSTEVTSLLVGGGVGVPPLAMLSSRIELGERIALIGARSKNDVLCIGEFSRHGFEVEAATEDGSYGQRGLVTGLLKNHLDEITHKNASCRVYSCGPLAMLRAVADLCSKANIPCQVSLEESMPCGIGVCNGCVVPILGAGDDYGRYRRICADGPVMNAEDVDWTPEF